MPARKSPDTFDISDPSDDKELVFGRLYCIFRIELVSDIDVDGEPEERDLVLLKILFPILFCNNFVCKMYIFCIHIVNCIFNFVYNLQTLYPFCIQNWYKVDTELIHFHFGRSFHGLIQSICKKERDMKAWTGELPSIFTTVAMKNLWRNRTGEVYGQFFPLTTFLASYYLPLQIPFHGGQQRMTKQLMSGGRSRWPATGDGINSTNFIVNMATKFSWVNKFWSQN